LTTTENPGPVDPDDPLRKKERILDREPWRSMRVTGFIRPAETSRWLITTFEVPRGDPSQRHEMLHMGRYVPAGVVYTRLVRKTLREMTTFLTLVMSDTPDELTDHGAIIERAAAATRPFSVLVNGLGLGCVVKGLLANPLIANVDVVEVDWELIRLVGPYYLNRRVGRRQVGSSLRSRDGRLRIHHADAFAKTWPPDAWWDLVWHDVWDFVDPVNLEDETNANPGTYNSLRRRYEGLCGWQGAWAEEILR
jgi:hypothetical protein